MKILPLRSLNARLLLAILTSMLIALAVGGTIIHETFKQRLLDDLDDSLRADLSVQILICVQEVDGIRFLMTDREAYRQLDPKNPIFFQYRYAKSGRNFSRSANLEGHDLSEIGLRSPGLLFERIELFNGNPARAVGFTFYPKKVTYPSDPDRDGAGDNPGEDVADLPPIRMHVVIAKELNSVLDALRQLRGVMYQVAVGLTVLLLASTTFFLRRNLQPLKQLSDQIESTPVTGGSSHFELRGAPSELDPVVERLNTLMDRVEGAFERERHFTANAAHELRNPLAGMRSQIELSLGVERSAGEYRETLDGLYDIQQGMERVVENLLILARLESGEQPVEQEIVPLTEVLRRGWRKVFDLAEQKQLQVTWDIQKGLPALVTARNLVSIIVRNLLDNAVDYSPDGGAVKISAHYDRLTSRASIRVANQNTSLSKDDCEQMFELFWRGQEDDSSHRHAGLGLGLCRRIVHILKGELKVRLTEGDQTIEFVCTFPCATLGEPSNQ